jgi:hypothetical protein
MTDDEPSDREWKRRTDRRRERLSFWDPRRIRGRRMRNRRSEEDGRPYTVDRISATDFAMAAMLLVLTLLDGLLTHVLLDHGYEEANPVMRFLIERGTVWFFVGKYVLTAVFLPVALVMNRYRLFGTRLRVGHMVRVVAALYLVLIVYQVGLWRGRHSHPSWSGSVEAFSFRGSGS